MTPAAMLRGSEVLRRLKDGVQIGAEIGVFRGSMSSVLLCRPDVILFMVDNWKGNEEYADIGHGAKDQDKNKEMALANTRYAVQRRRVLHADSAKASLNITDGSLDFVFIDADHSYEGVKSDIFHWRPKLKKGGLLGGHDYANPRHGFGVEVKRAVDEAVKAYDWNLDLGRNTTWFVRV